MLKIDGRTISIHRGDTGSITYQIVAEYNEDGTVKTYYSFQEGDKIQFTLFNKKGYDQAPILTKEFTVADVGISITLELTEEDTIIGDPANKTVVYWYEISLNETETTIGYDDDEGAAEFRLLPAKGEVISDE